MAVGALVLDVRGGDRDAALSLLLGVVDLIEGLGAAAEALRRDLGDGRRQRGLAVVDVSDGSYVQVLLVHGSFSFLWSPQISSRRVCG